MPDLSPLKFKVAIQDEATEQLNKIEQEFSKLKEKTISVKVEGLSDLHNLLNALQTQQVGNLGKAVANSVKDATQGLQQQAATAVRNELKELAVNLATIKEAIKNDNFTAFSTRIQKCAEKVATLNTVFKEFKVTLSDGAGMNNFMSGISEVVRNISASVSMLQSIKNGNFNLSTGGAVASTQNPATQVKEETQHISQNTSAKQKNASASSQLAIEEKNLAAAISQTSSSAKIQSQILSDLKTMATQYLGVWGAQQFVHNIIETGGQLEMQRLSIGAILQDTIKANHLFEQIKEKAVKSPFGVVQLDQMTKQLTAYGFKYNELYDMTNRLADISAATGTDVGRLALALGHVRSEAALSGYTLRQFSMANIPLLEKLSERLGKTTQEIRDMTRKKEIGYDDVVGVLKDLTNEGGMFYNMQEVISESVKAKFKNVRDAMDIMYGEMAEGKIGDALKEIASLLLVLTRHWKEVGAVMVVAAGYWTLLRAKTLLSTAAIGGNTSATLKQMLADKRAIAETARRAQATRELSAMEKHAMTTTNVLTTEDYKQAVADGILTKEKLRLLIALRQVSEQEAQNMVQAGLLSQAEVQAAMNTNRASALFRQAGMNAKSALMGVGGGTWAMLGMMIGTEIYMAYSNWIDRIDEKTKEMQDLTKSRILDIEKEQKAIKTEGKPKDTATMKNRVNSMKQVLANSEAYTKSLDEQIKKAGSLNKQYDILVEAMKDVEESSYAQLDAQAKAGELVKASEGKFEWRDLANYGLSVINPFTLLSDSSQETLSKVWSHLTTDDITKNLQDVEKSYADLRQSISAAWEYREALKSLFDEILNSENISDELRKELSDMPFEQQLYILATSGYWDQIQDNIITTGNKFGNSSEEIAKTLKNLQDGIKEVGGRWTTVLEDNMPKVEAKLQEMYHGNQKEIQKWATANVDEVRRMLDGILDQANEKVPMIRRMFKLLAYNYMTMGTLMKEVSMSDIISGKVWDVNKLLSNPNVKKLLDDEENADPNNRPHATPKSKDKGSKGSKKDSELEAWKEEWHELQQFYQQYRNWEKQIGEDKALDKLFRSGLWSRFFDDNGKLIYNIKKWEEAIDQFLGKLKGNTVPRKKFIFDVSLSKQSVELDRLKDLAKEDNDEMKEYMRTITQQWKMYKDLYKKTNDRDFAGLAFRSPIEWDDATRALYTRLDKEIKDRGVASFDSKNFSWFMTRKEAEELWGRGEDMKSLIDLFMKLQDLLYKNGEEQLRRSAEARNGAMTEREKLDQLETDLANIRTKKANLPPGTSQERIRGYEWEEAAKLKEISKQRWEVFKVENDWGRVFGDLENMSLDTIIYMIDAMSDFANNINSEDVQTVKAYQEALQKLEDQLINRDAFRQIPNLLNEVRERKEEEEAAKLALDTVTEAAERGDAGADEAKENAEKRYREAQDNTTHATNKMRKALIVVASDLQKFGSSLQQLGNLIGGKGGRLLSAFGGGFSGLGSGLEGLINANKMNAGLGQISAYVSAYTALASAMYEMNMALKEVLPNEDKLYNHYARKQAEINKMRKSVDDYRIAVAKANSEEENWLYSNGLTELKTKAGEWGSAVNAYKDAYFEEQAIYKNKSSSLKKNIVPIAAGVIGAVVGSIIAPGLGTALGAGIAAGIAGGIVGAGVGYAVGQLGQAGYESLAYRQGYTGAFNNLRIETRRKSFWHGQRTADLKDWAKEKYGEDLFSFDKLTGLELVNLDMANQILKDYGNKLVGQTKETLEALVEYAEEIKEFSESIREYVSGAFSPLADNMTDALWDWLTDGRDAFDSFKSYASNTFRDIAKDAVKAFLKVHILDGFKDELEGLFGDYGLGKKSEDQLMSEVARLGGAVGNAFKQYIPTLERALTVWSDGMQMSGYDIVNGSTGANDTLSQGIKGVTETTADIIASYMNAMRADMSVNRGMIANFITVLWPEYQKSYADQVTAVSRIDTNVQAIMIMMRDGGGAMYKAISSMESKLANVIDGVESISVR